MSSLVVMTVVHHCCYCIFCCCLLSVDDVDAAANDVDHDGHHCSSVTSTIKASAGEEEEPYTA